MKGGHADCCRTVHGAGLLDNSRLFLDRGGGVAGLREIAEKNRDEAKGGEMEGGCTDNGANLK